MEELLEEMKALRVTEIQAIARLAKVGVQTQWVVTKMQWVVAEGSGLVEGVTMRVVVMQANSS